jgi:hypothetical protein
MIRYRNPRRPDEAGMVIVSNQADAELTKELLTRNGLIVTNDEPLEPPHRLEGPS